MPGADRHHRQAGLAHQGKIGEFRIGFNVGQRHRGLHRRHRFDDVPPGTNVVAQQVPAGYEQTSPFPHVGYETRVRSSVTGLNFGNHTTNFGGTAFDDRGEVSLIRSSKASTIYNLAGSSMAPLVQLNGPFGPSKRPPRY